MSDRKTRAKTGCLSCRQRRVKCDERKPSCERCEKANIICNGYETPRVLPMKKGGSFDADSGSEPPKHSISPQVTELPIPFVLATTNQSLAQELTASSLGHGNPELACGGISLNYPQIPHRRAQEALAYQQYQAKTSKLLFHDENQYYWTGWVLYQAWELDYVYDAVIALGAVHRAVVLLRDDRNKRFGLETQILAFEAYGRALERIHEICADSEGVDKDLLVTLLLLLTYFESLVGNSASAFRHLRTAYHYLSIHNTSLANREPLISCANEFALGAQIVLPVEHFPLYANELARDTNDFSTRRLFLSSVSGSGLQHILDFICEHPRVNRAVWTPMSRTEDIVEVDLLLNFQARLMQVHNAFVPKEETLQALQSSVWAANSDAMDTSLDMPPQGIQCANADVALAHSIFSIYMARTHLMLSKKLTQDSQQRATLAQRYSYHVFRFIEGLNLQGAANTAADAKTPYTFCNAIRIGFTPVLFFAATLLNNTTWHKWAASKLRIIKREGLYNGLYLAKALDLLDVFNAHAEQSFHPGAGTITPVLFPDAEDRSLAIYYARDLPRSQYHTHTPVQILGRACWSKSSSSSPNQQAGGNGENLAVEFYDLGNEINGDGMETCAYFRIARREPNVREWHELFRQPGMEGVGLDLEVYLSAW